MENKPELICVMGPYSGWRYGTRRYIMKLYEVYRESIHFKGLQEGIYTKTYARHQSPQGYQISEPPLAVYKPY